MSKCTIEHAKSTTDLSWKGGPVTTKKGYNVTVPTSNGSREVFVEHLSEAFSIIGKYDNEADKIERDAKRLADYLTSDEGAWGRQDSFDNNLK